MDELRQKIGRIPYSIIRPCFPQFFIDFAILFFDVVANAGGMG
jgi:hypothetical protein